MSIASKLPDREIAICRRLIELRELLGIDQKTFGRLFGGNRDRVASFENFRAPLRFKIGDRLCANLDLNQRWLATGELPRLRYMDFSGAAKGLIEPRALFSTAYDGVFKPWIEEALKGESFITMHHPEELDFHLISNNEWKIRRGGGLPQIDPSALLCPLLVSDIRKTFDELKPEWRSQFYRHLSRSIMECLPKHYLVIDGVEKGPYAIVLLQEILARNVADGSTLVRTEGRDGHRTLKDTVASSSYRAAAKTWFRPPPTIS